MLKEALEYAARGWRVFPCRTGDKAPATPKSKPPSDDNPDGKGGLYYGTTDAGQVREWWSVSSRDPNRNVGVRTGPTSGIWVLDVDGEAGEQSLLKLTAEHGALPRTLVQKTGRGGRHYFFRWSDDADVRNRGKFAPGLDVRGHGGYVLAPPSRLTGHGSYEWLCSPSEPIAEAPRWLLDMVRKHARPPPEAPRPFTPRTLEGRASNYGSSTLTAICREVASASPGAQNVTLYEKSCRIGSLVGGGEIEDAYALEELVRAGLSMANGDPRDPWTRSVVEDIVRRGLDYGKQDPNFAPERPARSKPQLVTSGGAPVRGPISAMADPRSRPIEADPEDLDPGTTLTEDLLARVFAQKYAGRLCYCHNRGAWFEFDGSIWRQHRTPLAFHYAREMCRRLSAKLGSVVTVQKVRVAAGVEKFAQADPVFARSIEDFDRDPLLLGTPGGTVDLRTGKMRPALASDNITRATSVPPHAWADCPQWLEFLRQATGGDDELTYFLQQIAGYALTGLTSEQALFFIYGPGGNGKGVFINTLMKILGDYAQMAGMDTFTAGRHAAIPADLAMLAGARLVAASETGEGEKWDQKRIASLTGQDPITARFLRQNFFTFLPQFTLVIIGNHKPALSSVDDAMRRRINIIPFTIKPDAPDPELQHKLEQEWPAILRWAIDGAVEWQRNRLKRPKIVTDATEEYFEDQNVFEQWLAERCDVDPRNFHYCVASSHAFSDWQAYAKRSGEDPGSAKTFKSSMEKAGFTAKKDRFGRWFYGVQLRSSDEEN